MIPGKSFFSDRRNSFLDFGGHFTDDAILYLKGVTAAATHDLLTCTFKFE